MSTGAVLPGIKKLLCPQVRCLACDEPRKLAPGSPLCDACTARLETLRLSDWACPNCMSPKKAGQPCDYCAEGGMEGLAQAFAPYVYQSVAQQLIVRLKFGPVALAAQPLAQQMALCISGIRFDALVPVPLHRLNLRARGMNQSRLLCELIADQTGLPILDALQKTRKTRRQSSLLPRQRAANVKDVFAGVQEVKGLQLCLVDDVRTTGSTAREAARVLLLAGAASVCLLTAAVAKAGGANDNK